MLVEEFSLQKVLLIEQKHLLGGEEIKENWSKTKYFI